MILSLKELILKGSFSGIELGMSKETIENQTGAFHDWTDCGNNLGIGRYGVLEFHFQDNELTLIWCDNLSHLSAGDMVFEPWFLETAKKKPVDNGYSIAKVVKQLIQAQANFSVKHDKYNFIVTVTQSGVTLYFEDETENEADRTKFRLVAFGKSIYK